MGRADYLDLGSWNALCDRCGKKFKASMLRKDWQGLYVCERDWEPRHPQDFVRGVQDVQTVPWSRSPPADVFIAFCDINGQSAIPGYAIPGCMIPGSTRLERG